MAAGDVTTGAGRPADGFLRKAVSRAGLSGLYDLTRRYGARAGIFLANFGFAKAAAYLGPLVLARLLTSDLYGAIEFSWSSGMLAATVLGLGVSSALPQLMLLRRPMPAADIMALFVAVPGGLALCLSLVLTIAGGSPAAVLVLNCIVLAIAQNHATAYARTTSHRNLAVWIENLATHAVVLVAVVAALLHAAAMPAVAGGTAAAAFLMTAGAAFVVHRSRAADFAARARTAIRLGLPLLIYGLCSTWVAVSGRFYVGATLGASELASYSVSFRLASALLIVHAILGTALFARLYRLPARQYDKYLCIYQALIAAVSVLMIVSYPSVLPWLRLQAIDARGQADSIAIFPIVLLHVFGWNAWATLEMRIARARRGGQAAWRTLLVFSVFGLLLGALFWMNALTLRTAAGLISAQVVAGVAVQLYVLWRRGMKMRRTGTALVLGAAAIMAAGWAMS